MDVGCLFVWSDCSSKLQDRFARGFFSKTVLIIPKRLIAPKNRAII